MGVIQIIQDVNNQQTFFYRVCGQKIITNTELKSLQAFIDNDVHDTFLDIIIPAKSKERIIFDGVSWLAEKNRQIICSKSELGYWMNVPELCKFFISEDGSKIIQISPSRPNHLLTAQNLEYILLGPPLMMALALNQFFALHSSSVEIGGKAVLFTGESGFGKSTIAKYLQSESGLIRLSDDISVISKPDSKFILNADFPQLKLSDNSHKSLSDNRDIGAVIVLSRQQTNTEVKLTRLNSIDAIQVLLNHGVAAQLFDKTLASRHLRFMADLTSEIPIYRLEYPSGIDKIPAAAKILKNEFD